VKFCQARKAKLAKLEKANLHYKARLLHKVLTAIKRRPQWLKRVNAAVAAKLHDRNQNALRFLYLINFSRLLLTVLQSWVSVEGILLAKIHFCQT